MKTLSTLFVSYSPLPIYFSIHWCPVSTISSRSSNCFDQDIHSGESNRHYAVLILFDASASCNTVEHSLLCEILSSLHIDSAMLFKVFAAFFSDGMGREWTSSIHCLKVDILITSVFSLQTVSLITSFIPMALITTTSSVYSWGSEKYI